MRLQLFLIVLTLIASTLTGIAEEMRIGDYSFENKLGPTIVKKIDDKAYSCYWPTGVPSKKAEVELIVVTYDAAAAKKVRDKGESLLTSAVSRYLGLSGRPDSVNKTLFFKKTSARRAYKSMTPRKHRADVYSKVLPGGNYLVVGVRSFKSPNPLARKLSIAIANNFKLATDKPEAKNAAQSWFP